MNLILAPSWRSISRGKKLSVGPLKQYENVERLFNESVKDEKEG
jgi:hypothetical protein